MTQDYESVLMGFPLFSGFTSHGASLMIDAGEVQELGAGEILFEEGAEPNSLVLVLDGQVEIYVQRDGRDIVLSRIGAGALIGELAVLCESPRAASVRIPDGATVLRWEARQFRSMLLRDPRLAKAVFSAALQVLVEKQQALIEELAGKQE